MLDTIAKQKIVKETLKRLFDESESTRHYANIAKVIQQLQNSIAEHSSVVADNKLILNEFYKLMGISEKNSVRYKEQMEEMSKEIERISSLDFTGEKGDDGHTPTKTELLSLIEPLIPEIKNDEEKIIKNVLSRIKVENGKDAIIDEDKLIEKLIEYIKEKKPIDISHIRNWQSLKQSNKEKISMNDMRWHGGGISALASVILTVSGTIDDSNVTFTTTSEPSILIINGGSYLPTGGAISWSYLSGTLTLSVPVGINGTIFGLK